MNFDRVNGFPYGSKLGNICLLATSIHSPIKGHIIRIIASIVTEKDRKR